MKHFIKILFLGISILFSFGFTTSQSTCKKNIKEITDSQNAHSCCSPKEKTSCCNKEKDSCTTNKNCDGDCCLSFGHLFLLNDFVTNSVTLEKVKVFESNKNTELKTVYLLPITIDLLSKKHTHYYYYSYTNKPAGKKLISLKQAWLI